ncbi:uncharacterized protein VTP21DRAFT_6630 [Calcarisporiella thermophila]|uniref:uncharacterized protein n=1 Tax=Calcarisporiella thermophila TaxID=911321 RepID=UPI003742AC2A
MVSVPNGSYPKNVGILAMEIYFPKRYIDQEELEKFDGVSSGKYTIGLGQSKMAFCDDREDIQSICLTAVQSLMEKYNISYKDIGRLEVGTETIIDKSKSVKSTLMQLFVESGNSEVEGIDTTNACYGGTAALSNAINWIESSSWDGRYALVVAGDIAVYASGSARPTGGAGCVAMLIGTDAPIVFERGLRATHMEHVYDFYKPDLTSEYPVVDGHFSNVCYLRGFDNCYNRYMQRLSAAEKVENPDRRLLDYVVFHCPYTKLVIKTVGRMAYNDFRRNPTDSQYEALQQFRDIDLDSSYSNRDLEKAFIAHTKSDLAQKVEPSLLASRNIGNMYTASVYACLATLISQTSSEALLGKRIALFSYGSGAAATMFSMRVVGSTAAMAKHLTVAQRLNSRVPMSPETFTKLMALREETHNVKDYEPAGSLDDLFPGTYYIEKVDAKYRRFYKRVESSN